ncbi:histidinol-phosphatase [Algimonas ampicilliniresistens]|uniref:Histidinol-phosphatase n=1 Tax=Algimonas ampicilliniresistens TaxID=1298735 RepID=A0ABQ5VAT4_9PROT|nr:inositol monophosphatase family protein [Algimonas ampicilliniresistens]GLQ24631.1 histidinol-phosphatase [Algimonas ampicilliniresistens]
MTAISDRLAFFDTLSDAARAITLPLFRSGVSAQNKAPSEGKPGYDPVTQADVEAERELRRLIRAQFPDDSIEGEELPDHVGSNAFSWTLDPIDGTRGFVAGVPVWSTLIALSQDDQPVLGLVDLPAMGIRALGDLSNKPTSTLIRDDGTSTPLSVRTIERLSDARLGCTQPFGMFGPGELAAYKIIQSGVAFSRLGLDAFGYVLLAQGRMDLVIEAEMKPCDVRALMPVVIGAGGVITDWHGGNPKDGPRLVACGSPDLMPELYTYLGRAMT